MDHQYRYYAFISYSHKDEKWAKWLQRKLESYRLPSVIRKEAGGGLPMRIKPVFRDATDLSVGKLRENLHQELEDSRFLIVVCSPNSASPNREGKHWVDNEVREFCRMGREGNIIPVIVDGVPNDPANECFCPAIKELDMLAIDTAKAGKLRALNDVVAKILGLRPDELWRREERRLRTKRIMNIAAILIILAAMLFCADYYIPKTRYFKTSVDINGILTGIVPLEKSQLAYIAEYEIHRFQKYKLLGINQVKRSELPTFLRYSYDSEGQVTGRNSINSRGVILCHTQYNNDATQVFFKRISTDPEQRIKELPVSIDDGDMNLGQIYSWSIKRDSQGRIHKIFYLDVFGSPVGTQSGAFGEEFEYWPDGLLKSKYYLLEDGSRKVDEHGLAGFGYEYNHTNGDITRYSHLNERGEPTENSDGWLTMVTKYSYGKKTIIEETYMDRQNQPCVSLEMKCSRRVIAYDVGRKEEKTDLYSISNELLRTEIREFDSKNRMCTLKFLDAAGNPIFNNSFLAHCSDLLNRQDPNMLRSCLFATGHYSYNDYDELVEERYFGPDGKPIPIFISTPQVPSFLRHAEEKEFSGMQQNAEYREITKLSSEQLKSNLVGGWYVIRYHYDSFGQRISEKYFDAENQPCLLNNGIHESRSSYDHFQRVVEFATYDLSNKLCKDSYTNIARTQIDYNEQGKEKSRSFFDQNNQLQNENSFGYAHTRSQFDERGRNVETSIWNAASNGKLIPAGGFDEIHRIVTIYHDNAEETLLYGVDGKLWRHPNFSAKRFQIKEYDEFRNCTKTTRFFDADGKLMLDDKKRAIVVDRFDRQGRLLERCFYDTDGNPCAGGFGGHFKEIHQYAPSGYRTHTTLIDKWDKEIVTSECDMDAFGRIKEVRYKRAGVLSAEAGVDGVAVIRWEYDKFGMAGSYFAFDEKGEKCNNRFGYHQKTELCDKYGNCIEVFHLDKNGKLKNNQMGWARATAQYDNGIRLISTQSFDQDGKPAFNPLLGGVKLDLDYQFYPERMIFRRHMPNGDYQIETYWNTNRSMECEFFHSDGSKAENQFGIHKIISNDRSLHPRMVLFDQIGREIISTVVCVAINPFSPAYFQKIQPGDIFIALNDWDFNQGGNALIYTLKKYENREKSLTLARAEGQHYRILNFKLPPGLMGIGYRIVSIKDKEMQKKLITAREKSKMISAK